jgi:predicted CXXCH cytochrome family protein
VSAELALLGAPPPPATAATAATPETLIRALRARFDASKLLEIGIGCESCHGGSREHVRHNATRPSYLPRASFLKVTLPLGAGDDARAASINRVCARCHQVLFTRYPFTWEGGLRRAAVPGGSNINSGEARDLLLGGCAGRMACSDCHDPHAHNRPHQDDLEARADGVCLRCHEKYAGAVAQRAHTHHDPAGAGGRCLACHMPRKNMTLDNRLGRYHRVGSPTETAKVEGDRPVECALCHGDRPVEWALATMETWWGKRYDRDRLRGLYGPDLEHGDVLLSTLGRGKPHEQAVALALLGARADKRTAPAVAAQLTHPIPILRYYAVAALEAMLGGPSPLDVHAGNDVITAAARAWLTSAGVAAAAPALVPAPAPAAASPASDED